jgi:protein gp37
LAEQHGDELRPAGKALGVTLGGVLLHQSGKLRPGKVLEQLIEEARDLYDWIALLWAACGEAPGKERLANVDYRRALLLFQSARTCFGQEWFFFKQWGGVRKNLTGRLLGGRTYDEMPERVAA